MWGEWLKGMIRFLWVRFRRRGWGFFKLFGIGFYVRIVSFWLLDVFDVGFFSRLFGFYFGLILGKLFSFLRLVFFFVKWAR